MIEIVVRKRSGDWMAFVKHRPGVWECGHTPAEAVGRLIFLMPSHGITNVALEGQGRDGMPLQISWSGEWPREKTR